MSTPIPFRVLLIGPDSTKAARDAVAEILNEKHKALLPKGAAVRGRFESATDLAKAISADGPSAVVAIDDPQQEEGAAANSDDNDNDASKSNSKKAMSNAHIFRVWANVPSWSEATAAQQIIDALADNCRQLRPTFLSSRGGAKSSTSFLGAIRQGLAVDGGLFTPEKVLPVDHIEALHAIARHGGGKNYGAVALALLERLVDVFQVPPGVLANMIEIAYRNEAWPLSGGKTMPLQKMPTEASGGKAAATFGGHDVYVAELFHGPTAAFKDFALQLFPQMFAQSLLEQNVEQAAAAAAASDDGRENTGASSASGSVVDKYMILAATSGDTGVSAIRGFMNGAPHVKVMVLYPKDGVSPVQREQMLSCHGGNVAVLGVDGDFDLCQTTVKKIFNDGEVSQALVEKAGTRLSSANSINWGRLLPQIAYYFWTWTQLSISSSSSSSSSPSLASLPKFDAVVPTGNFGNILAAYFAKRMGCGIRRLVLASNTNDVLCEFIRTGTYDISTRTLKVTASPSIDILKASNIERLLFYLSDYDADLVAKLMKQLETDKKFTVPEKLFRRIQEDFVSFRCTEQECAREVAAAAAHGVLLDPHTAVALFAARAYRSSLAVSAAAPVLEVQDKSVEVASASISSSGASASASRPPPPLVIMSTAHWAKFPDAVLQALKDGSFPPAESSNKIPAAAVVEIWREVVSKMKSDSDAEKNGLPPIEVAFPLRKAFENLGKEAPAQCSGKYDDIKNAVIAFAAAASKN